MSFLWRSWDVVGPPRNGDHFYVVYALTIFPALSYFQYATCLMVILAIEISMGIYAAMHSHMVSMKVNEIIVEFSLRMISEKF